MKTSSPVKAAGSRTLFLVVLAALALITLGLLRHGDGQLEAAITTQRARVALAPTASDLNDLANLLVVRGDLSEAEQAYRDAKSIAPESIEINYNLALLLQFLEKDREALQLFRKVVKLAPEAAWAHLQIGVLSADAGKRRQAIDAFATAFILEPRLASPQVNPHLVDRPEVLEAMLRSSKDIRVAQTAPLSFSDPDRISRLLIADSSAARTAARAVERRGLLEAAKKPAGENTAEEEEAATRLDLESLPQDLRDQEGDQARRPTLPDFESEPAEPDVTSAEETATSAPARRVVGAQDLQPVRGSSATGAPTRETPNRSRQPANVGTPSGTPTDSSPSRFRPGRRSSAQLELRETPARPEESVGRWAIGG